MKLAKELIMSSAYWVLNKTVVKELGIETAFLLSNMTEAETTVGDAEGWFYQTIGTVESITGLSRYSQNKALSQLSELGIVEQQNRGIPMKRYFKISYENLNKLLCESVTSKGVNNSHTRMLKTNTQDSEKLTTSKELSNKELSNKEISNKDSAEELSPTTDKVKEKTQAEVEDEFFQEIWSAYPNKKGKGRIKPSTKRAIFKLGDELYRCLDRYIDYVTKQRESGFKDLQYQSGSTFFNSGYVDYLDENYSESEAETKTPYKPKVSDDKMEALKRMRTEDRGDTNGGFM